MINYDNDARRMRAKKWGWDGGEGANARSPMAGIRRKSAITVNY